MKRKTFEIEIKATREQVWKVLWNDTSYRKWAASFMDGSYAKTDWQKGSKVLFLGPDQNGMVSKIETNKPFELMSIQHLGVVKNGIEDTKSSEAREWAGIENYILKNTEEGISLKVETDIPEKYLKSFEKAWGKALNKIKLLAEIENSNA